MKNIKTRLSANGIVSGYTVVEKGEGQRHLSHHEYEFKDKEDVRRFFAPHFRNVCVFETQYPGRHNLYFWASDGSLPFSPQWAGASNTRLGYWRRATSCLTLSTSACATRCFLIEGTPIQNHRGGRVKNFAALREVGLSSIQPEGWLRRYFEIQRDGLTGHPEHARFPFDTGGWNSFHVAHRSGDAWWPYEQTGYWFDGMARCGYLLRDDFLIQKANRPMDYILRRADKDGYLGPRFMKGPKGQLRWAHAVFFRALMARQSATGDRRIVRALVRHYLSYTAPHSDSRDVCNVENILWTYSQTGDRRLLRHAVKAYAAFNKLNPHSDTVVKNLLSAKRPKEHGVSYNEIGKLGAILYMYTGNRRFLNAAINGYRKIDRFAMLVDGVNSSTEGLKGKDPLDSHETCDIADYTWSVGYLLLATGRAEYADKIERACFNAAPGAVRADFKGLQYFSCPNQVVADATSNHNEFFYGHRWMSYRPNPGTECCPGEVNRIMPNFAARMWMTDPAGASVAALYGPSQFSFNPGSGRQAVTIVEETAYPFSDRIDFEVRTVRPVEFPLTLRIPGWCRKARLLINGKPLARKLKAGTFATIRRCFANNDRVTLLLPMELKLSRWPRGGIAVERGPLVFSLRIDEDWSIDRKEKKCSRQFPAWNLHPASPWNYALAVNEKNLRKVVEVVQKPVTPEPWSIHTAPIELRVPARLVRGWKMIHKKSVRLNTGWCDGKFIMKRVKGNYQFTPQLPERTTLRKRLSPKTETVTLIPYGCTKLRLTVFPQG